MHRPGQRPPGAGASHRKGERTATPSPRRTVHHDRTQPTHRGPDRRRLRGDKPDAATRLVSLYDRDARPIAKGRLNRPVEFGYKAQVVDNADGIVLDYDVREGNPPDAPQLAPAITRVRDRTGQVPDAVTADRGYGEARVDADLHALGARTVAIPRKGQPGAARQAAQRRRGFRDLVKWRTGCEGRLSHLKHRYGWARTGLDGREGAAIWCGRP